MRLMEAIIDANHRAAEGDHGAGLHPAEFADELPLVALTCIDPRLNALFPAALGIPEDQFIWLRNAGNIITGPMSSTMRSLALACAVKGGKEIVVIGHTDCQVGKTTTLQLLDRFRAMGVERHLLPENLAEFFGSFASERQNVIRGTDFIRQSALIGPKIPVHGLLVDIRSGKLDLLVNGYQALQTISSRWKEMTGSARHTLDALKSLADFKTEEIPFPEGNIGDVAATTQQWLANKFTPALPVPGVPPPPPPDPSLSAKLPLPPRIPSPLHVRQVNKR